MKAAAVLALAGAVMVSTQSTDGLADCAKACANSMLGTTENLPCGANDLSCRCANANFYYGLRDCGNEACQNDDAVTWGSQRCASIGVPMVVSGPGENGGTSAIATSDVPVTITSDGSTITTSTPTTIYGPVDSAVSSAAGAVSTWTSVVTSGSVVQTLTGVATLSGTNSIAIPSSAPVTTSTSPLVSTVVSGSSTFVTTTGSSTITEAASSTSDGAAESTSSEAGAQKTAAHILLAAAVAAVLL